MRVANTELPKVTRETAPPLDPKIVKEALKDLEGSYDFMPYAYSDGTEYETHSLATSKAGITVKALARETGEDSRMFRRKVWDKNGGKDRKAKGKWVFAVSRRSTPPPPRKPRKPKVAAVAA